VRLAHALRRRLLLRQPLLHLHALQLFLPLPLVMALLLLESSLLMLLLLLLWVRLLRQLMLRLLPLLHPHGV